MRAHWLVFFASALCAAASPAWAEVRAKVGDLLVPDTSKSTQGMRFSLPQGTPSPTPEEEGKRVWKVLPERGVLFIRPGSGTVPSLEISDAQGAVVAHTPEIPVVVEAVIDPKDPNAKKKAEMLGPEVVGMPLWALLLSVLLALAVVGALFFGVRRWLKMRRDRIANRAKPEIMISEDQKALREIRLLRGAKMWEDRKTKAHYFRVSAVMKTYIAERFAIDAEELATSELLIELSAKEPATTRGSMS